MPSMRYTPNNPGGQLVEDPLDQIESGNRGAAIQAAGLNAGMLQNQQMTQLMLARLASEDYHYGQDRTDKLGMFNQGLQAQGQALDKEYGYLGQRDKSADDHWQKQWQFQTDPTVNPMLKSQLGLNEAQTQEMIDRITQSKFERERAAKAGDGVLPINPRNPVETAKIPALIAAGQNPAQVNSSIISDRAAAAQKEVDPLKASYGEAIDDATSGSLPFLRLFPDSYDMTGDNAYGHDQENRQVLQTRDSLKQKLVDSGMAPEDADVQIKTIERKHKHTFPTRQAERLYSALGW